VGAVEILLFGGELGVHSGTSGKRPVDATPVPSRFTLV
jgi:hypothetical protein